MEKTIISKPTELPKTKIAWWALILGLGPVLIFGIIKALSPILTKLDESVGLIIAYGAVFFPIILTLSAIIASICAFIKGERSWVVWVGFIYAIIVGAASNIFLFAALGIST